MNALLRRSDNINHLNSISREIRTAMVERLEEADESSTEQCNYECTLKNAGRPVSKRDRNFKLLHWLRSFDNS